MISFLRWYLVARIYFVLGWPHPDLKSLISPRIGGDELMVLGRGLCDCRTEPTLQTTPARGHHVPTKETRCSAGARSPKVFQTWRPRSLKQKRLTWWILTQGLRVRMRQAVILLFLAAGVCLYQNTLYACYPANLASCQKLPGNGFPAGLISSNCDAPVILPTSFLTIN